MRFSDEGLGCGSRIEIRDEGLGCAWGLNNNQRSRTGMWVRDKTRMWNCFLRVIFDPTSDLVASVLYTGRIK